MIHRVLTASVAATIALACAPAMAEEEGAEPRNLTVTTTLASDYIFRGMTQTWNKPTLQASVDYVHPSGFFGNLWASNIDDKVIAGGRSEIDLTAGYRGVINEDTGYNISLLRVIYPGANYKSIGYASYPDQKYDFTELGVGLSYKWLSFKYSYTLTDLMGFNEKTGYTSGTKGSTYLDLSAEIPLPSDFSLGLHVGHQNLKAKLVTPTAGGETDPDFTDYRLSLTRKLPDDWSASLAYTWNDNRDFFDRTPSNQDLGDTCNVGRKRFTVSVSKTF